LTVSFNSRISPHTLTSIFFVKSPPATAFVNYAIERTWFVKFMAMRFTLSVSTYNEEGLALGLIVKDELRTFHMPCTSEMNACPPKIPSIPTSKLSHHRVIGHLQIEHLALHVSTFTSLPRSPNATALVTSEIDRTWPVKLEAIFYVQNE
jgi:hypothetical protein